MKGGVTVLDLDVKAVQTDWYLYCYKIEGPVTVRGQYKLSGNLITSILYTYDYGEELTIKRPLDMLCRYYFNHRSLSFIFQNRFPSELIPPKPFGYYRYVKLPIGSCKDVLNMERLILGGNGEVFYTADHYNTFTKISV